MSWFDKIVRPHYKRFCDDGDGVDPVVLAAKLSTLNAKDLSEIARQTDKGRLNGIVHLETVINGKVKWLELYEALYRANHEEWAEILAEEYYKFRPTELHNRPSKEILRLGRSEDRQNIPTNTLTRQRINYCNGPVTTINHIYHIYGDVVNSQVGNGNVMNACRNSLESDDCESPKEEVDIKVCTSGIDEQDEDFEEIVYSRDRSIPVLLPTLRTSQRSNSCVEVCLSTTSSTGLSSTEAASMEDPLSMTLEKTYSDDRGFRTDETNSSFRDSNSEDLDAINGRSMTLEKTYSDRVFRTDKTISSFTNSNSEDLDAVDAIRDVLDFVAEDLGVSLRRVKKNIENDDDTEIKTIVNNI